MENKKKTLVLVSDGFPLTGVTEKGFIMPEMDCLSKKFDRVILMPTKYGEGGCDLPGNVIVDKSFVGFPNLWGKIREIWRPIVWKMALRDLQYGRYGKNDRKRLRKSIAYSVYTLHYERRVRSFIKKNGLDPQQTVYYTFWFEFITSAFCRIKDLKVLTRVHRWDLYEDESTYVSHAWRELDLKRLAACCAVSKAGLDYLVGRYAGFEDRFRLRILGSEDPAALNPEAASRKNLTLLCCSNLRPEKGVPRQVDFVKEYARRNPEMNVSWIHIGGGPEQELLNERISNLPYNMHVELHGERQNEYVHAYMSTHHIDIFVLTSFSEGLPIAVCEAMSYGIPVLATDVGGVSEIVNDENGGLLSSDPDADEFCGKIQDMMPDLSGKRIKARSDWESGFRAKNVRTRFADELLGLLNGNGNSKI